MKSFSTRYAAAVAALVAATQALDAITVPATVAAGQSFQISFSGANSPPDLYRVYLAASVTGSRGTSCYLSNSTDLSSPLNLTIPASVGPSADYYSLAFADLSQSAAPQYSNMFNLTGGTGVPSEYETHLGGAPFWDADDLPCSAYNCARQCAQASYPDDLTEQSAYNTMKTCILACPNVSADANATAAPHATSTVNIQGDVATISGSGALITVASGVVLTAMETFVTKASTTMEEILLGSETLTMGGAQETISSAAFSAISDGVVVSGSSTVMFSSITAIETAAATTSSGASATAASASAKSSGAASRPELSLAAAVGVVGLAALFL